MDTMRAAVAEYSKALQLRENKRKPKAPGLGNLKKTMDTPLFKNIIFFR